MPKVNSIATPLMRVALHYLANAVKGYRLSEAPFVTLPDDTYTITINKLLERDWMVPSKVMVRVTYKITGRGLKVLEQIAAQQAKSARVGSMICRTEGCGNPVYVSNGKYRQTVCQTCYQAAARKRYAEGRGLANPYKPCSKCGGRRHVTQTGHVHCYCKACLYTVNKSYRDQYQAEVRETVARGETPHCKKRGCERPITRFPGGRASRYCRECQRREWSSWARRYKVKKRRRAYAAILKKA